MDWWARASWLWFRLGLRHIRKSRSRTRRVRWRPCRGMPTPTSAAKSLPASIDPASDWRTYRTICYRLRAARALRNCAKRRADLSRCSSLPTVRSWRLPRSFLWSNNRSTPKACPPWTIRSLPSFSASPTKTFTSPSKSVLPPVRRDAKDWRSGGYPATMSATIAFAMTSLLVSISKGTICIDNRFLFNKKKMIHSFIQSFCRKSFKHFFNGDIIILINSIM